MPWWDTLWNAIRRKPKAITSSGAPRLSPVRVKGVSQKITVTPAAVAAPVILPVDGSYPTAATMTMSCPTPGAQIRFTLDGSDPTITSALYTGPIILLSR